MGIFDAYRQELTDTAYATFGKLAMWTQGASDPVDVTVKLSQPDVEVRFGSSRGVVPSAVVKVRPGEVAEPAQGDLVEVFLDDGRTISAGTFKISADPEMLDPYRREWTCEAVLQS